MAKHWNPYGGIARVGGDYSGAWETLRATPTIASLRQPARYWIVSDAQLKRDLAGRTIKDVYRENRALRGVERRYVPRNFGETDSGGNFDGLAVSRQGIRSEYMAWCEARDHVPHPASVDSDHPQNCHRDKAPKRELQFASEHPDHILKMAA